MGVPQAHDGCLLLRCLRPVRVKDLLDPVRSPSGSCGLLLLGSWATWVTAVGSPIWAQLKLKSVSKLWQVALRSSSSSRYFIVELKHDLKTSIALLDLCYATNDSAFELSGIELKGLWQITLLALSYAANDITLLALSYVANERNILRREVEIVEGPFFVKLSLDLISFVVKLKSNLKMNVTGEHDSLRREVETVDGPFIVKLSLDLNILRREVEIQVCIVSSPISFAVKLKLALNKTEKPFRREVEL
ncbi:hypothetical protein F3Y22_tig00111582pilonHSYRG00907 [Hibiscus syriacus]|uniref:Uncharacterized protein n=1 Tax=Hibiscus syriacus TaxID=106335 RepID=A0A6A2Y0S3_HIBSY|nr:hypothetical protein F3Y22_tig00111582pilonHSYRG00907 [Hibiscus syriacus]